MDTSFPTQQTTPISQPTQPPIEAKKKSVVPIILIIVLLVILAIGGYAGYAFINKNSAVSKTREASGGVPTPKMTDLAPGIPAKQKTNVLIEHSDSSMEQYSMPTSQVDSYVKSLPPGDRMVSQTLAGQ